MGLLYTKMKIFHYQEKLDSLPATSKEILAPIHIRIKPTNACNHACSYCAYRAENLQLGQDMNLRDSIPADKMREIVDDLVSMGVKAVTFSGGGEPFLYPHLLATVKRLAAGGIKFASLTNGALVSGEVAEFFAHHAQWLRVSMDGWDDKSYAEYRRVKEGEFTKVMTNMIRFKKHGGGCYLGVCLIVDRRNAPQVYPLVKRLQEVGVNSVKVAPCIVSNSGQENNQYHAPIFEEVKEQIAKAIQDFHGPGFEIFDSYHGQLETFQKHYSWCPYLQILPVIGADLNVYPCHDKAYNLTDGLLGSIKEQRFKDFWFSDKNIFFTINPSERCNHHCVADGNNKLILDYLNADPDHLCFV